MRSILYCSKRLNLLIAISLGCNLSNAQESVSVSPSSFIQAEFGSMPFGYAGETTTDQLKALQTGDKNLDRDFSHYEENHGIYYYNGFPAEWYAGITYFRDLKMKNGLRWSLGLKYHMVYLGQKGYSFNTTSARDTFFNSRGEGMVQYEQISDGVQFMVGAHEMLVPLSIYWSGKKQRLVWIEPGVQLFPGLMFGARYDFYETISHSTFVTPVGQKPDDPHMHYADSVINFHEFYPLDGGGFSLNAGLPLSLYLRASRTHKVFSRIHLLLNLTPMFRFSYYPGMASQRYATASSSFGLRYHL